jgi:DNA-binding CsgD family transcriptional regulator
MTTLIEKDYHDILNTVYTLNCCENKETFLDTLMPSMLHMFHTDCVTFHLIQGYPWHIKVVESRSFKSARHSLSEDKFYPELYKEDFYQRSPLLKEAANSSKVILKLGESISLQDWEQSDMYNRFIAPQNLYWEMFMTLRWKNNLEGMITLWRSRDGGNYGGQDIQKAELLAPHLVVASRNIMASERLSIDQNSSPHGADNSSEGLILLDHRLKPLYFNSTAHRICFQINSSGTVPVKEQSNNEFAIPLCIRQDCLALIELLKTGKHPVLWPRESNIAVATGQKFHLESSLIWKADQVNSQPNFIVTLRAAAKEVGLSHDTDLKPLLSKREMDLIYYLNQGLSYEKVAEMLFISKQTVHTHVKNIYRKLGARSRIELYRYVHSSE